MLVNTFIKQPPKTINLKNFEALKNYLIKKPLKNQSLLIKGSRGMELERVLTLID